MFPPRPKMREGPVPSARQQRTKQAPSAFSTWTHVHTRTHMHSRVHAHVCTYTHNTYTYIHICIYTSIYTHTYTHTHRCAQAHVYTHIYAHIPTCLYTHIPTDTHTHVSSAHTHTHTPCKRSRGWGYGCGACHAGCPASPSSRGQVLSVGQGLVHGQRTQHEEGPCWPHPAPSHVLPVREPRPREQQLTHRAHHGPGTVLYTYQPT